MNGKNKRNWKSLIIVNFALLAFISFGYLTSLAQEHPKEHPSSSAKSTLTKESLAEAITKYINDDSRLKGGFFMVYDKTQGKSLTLTLVKVHNDRLAALGNGVYFACADFGSNDGNTYDVDIFMKDESGKLTASDISIHKVNGAARYDWIEKDGVWTKSEK